MFNWFKNLKISQRLAILALMTPITIAIIAGIGLYKTNALKYEYDNLYGFMLIPLLDVDKGNLHRAVLTYHLRELTRSDLSPDERAASIEAVRLEDKNMTDFIARYESEWKTTLSPEFSAALAALGQQHLQDIESKTLVNFHELYKAYAPLRDRLLSGEQIGFKEIGKYLTQMEETFDTLVKVNRQFADNSNESAQNTISQMRKLLVIFGVLLTFIALIVTWRISLQITTPLASLSRATQQLTEGNLELDSRNSSINQFTNRSDELGQLANLFYMMAKENNKQNWIKAGQAKLNDILSGEQEIITIANQVIYFLTSYMEGQVGLFYLLKTNNNKDDQKAYLQVIASYAYTTNENIPNKFGVGEGLVGQAAVQKKMLTRTQTPKEYAHIIQSGLISAVPEYVILVPFLYENEVKGVIEIGFSEKQPMTHQYEFIKQVMLNLGIAINTAESRDRMKELLDKTQKQAVALQTQQAELQQSNEELQSQSEELQSQSEELQLQQEELRQSNEELEERTKELEHQQVEILEKNLALQKSKEAIEIKAKDLELASKYKSEFLANMSHELRTPLNSLLILAQILAENDEKNLSEKQIEYAETIYSAGSDLLTLINDVLDLSKVEAGKIEIQSENVSLMALMETIEKKFQVFAEKKGFAFHIDAVDNLPDILHTDEQRLKQILNNMLSNAFKFTSEGEVRITIRRPLESEQDNISPFNLAADESIVISVSDTGIGIPKDKQEKVFEAFQQADGSTSRRFGGTGLGLSISRQFARALGGDLQLESEEGKGSTFKLYLPEKQVVNENDSDFQEKEEPSIDESDDSVINSTPPIIADDRDNLSENDKVLLIIEDDPIFVRITAELAREKHFKYLIATDGNSGLELAQQYKPHAIFLDVGLPLLDGWSVMELLKDDPETRHIPVYFMSGYDQSHDAKQMGAIGYLYKPINTEQLAEAFQNIQRVVSNKFKKLLIIVDNEKHQQKIEALVGGKEIEITLATTKLQALQELKQANFECLILDVDVEQGSGVELLEELSKDERLAKVPVIVHANRDLSVNEENILHKFSNKLTLKEVYSPERLLDEATLFLHQVEANLPAEKQQMLERVRDKQAIFKDKKILMVDDDVRNVFALVNVLEEKGMEVIVGQNGKEALQLLEEHPDFDLVLMDIMMPEMDGYEAMREIRKQVRFRKLPIIALTAKAMKSDKAKCIKAGANDYLAKPLDKTKLLSLMRVWLYR
jgi:signal transduction histidine kinase/DNA-binding response OmpR family regulator/HAMP domain-containing protein